TVKKLMLDPYLQLRERRDAATAGQKDEAQRLQASNEKSGTEITRQLEDAQRAIQSDRDRVRSVAMDKRASVMQAAEGDAKATLTAMREDLKKMVAEERTKLVAIADDLS